ncbi:MAG: phosphate propanoyltransferase [Clostridia bacterium]|nr:phosphate propanoyltransferase [Clostridia bacterium]
MERLTEKIIALLKSEVFIGVEASGRHVHLSQKDADALFGENYVFQKQKPLSQPGQFAAKERVDIITEKGAFKNVAILGPVRSESQVEISMTDARTLGLNPPVRLSGDTKNTPGITLRAGNREITLKEGVIVAKRHIHLTPKTAEKFGLSDNEAVKLKVFSSRPLVFDDTIVRVSSSFSDFVHIDYDEANACGFKNGDFALIIKKNAD